MKVKQHRIAVFTFCLSLSMIPNLVSASALPSNIDPPGEKVIVVSPRVHAWGAYDADGQLLKSGLASAGANWCKDINSPCRTHTGSYRIEALGDGKCISLRFPIPHGGAPMPYCMYFNGNQALHGSYNVVAGNISHGCVRMRVSDARWIRYNFAEAGTRVVILPY
ncbi:MAG: L,D-transpeptidase [Gammaproteobacteria bacterium]|nr:L,D-transpeptidase [Gammaproteobacteria bacterium]